MSGYLAMTSAKPFSRCAAATMPAMPSRSTTFPLGVAVFPGEIFHDLLARELSAFGMVHAVGCGDRRHNMINARYDRYALALGVGDRRPDRGAVGRSDDDIVSALSDQAVDVRDLLRGAIVRIGDYEFVAELFGLLLHALNDSGERRIGDGVSRVSDRDRLSRFSAQGLSCDEANGKNGCGGDRARPIAPQTAPHFVSSPHWNPPLFVSAKSPAWDFGLLDAKLDY